MHLVQPDWPWSSSNSGLVWCQPPGLRTGRPTDARWQRRPKVPMSEETEQRLIRLAAEANTPGRKISLMQLAAQILEEALAGWPGDNRR